MSNPFGFKPGSTEEKIYLENLKNSSQGKSIYGVNIESQNGLNIRFTGLNSQEERLARVIATEKVAANKLAAENRRISESKRTQTTGTTKTTSTSNLQKQTSGSNTPNITHITSSNSGLKTVCSGKLQENTPITKSSLSHEVCTATGKSLDRVIAESIYKLIEPLGESISKWLTEKEPEQTKKTL